jgi:outer membrane protein OmpA-like peptidoglycan-associated protein
MLKLLYILVGSLLTLTLFGCASEKNLIILMPDSDGSVGQVVVSNSAGSQTLTEAGQGIVVKDASTAPQAPTKIDEKKIEEIFGAALSAQPLSPTRFILYFKSDSTKLTKQSEKLIPDIFSAIQERDSSDISVVGHTDTKGSKEYNLKLSTQRAIAIAALIKTEGIAPDFIEVTSHGEGNPLVKTADNVSKRRNRRVEVTIR